MSTQQNKVGKGFAHTQNSTSRPLVKKNPRLVASLIDDNYGILGFRLAQDLFFSDKRCPVGLGRSLYKSHK
jgi:hypothetical protein